MRTYEVTREIANSYIYGGGFDTEGLSNIAQELLLEWLLESCTVHYNEHSTQSHTKNLMLGYYHKHRKDCPECWQSLLKNFGLLKKQGA